MKKLLKRMSEVVDNRGDKTEKDDKPKVKEAEKISFPKFPQPESCRNWRLRVREAVVAASDRPDDAFTWLSKVWEKDVKEEDLRDPEGFVTLDAKVLSAVTNILEGAFARQIDTFKEREANGGRLVRGRQVLFKLDNFFSTNAQHGSVYELEDLLSVKMVNEKLETFMHNWETVLSGIQNTPDEAFLEPLFHRQIKRCKDLAHDINIYERAIQGQPEKTYKFLYEAATNHLSRKRLERNRERIAKQYGADGKPSAPAPKKKFVPKGFCFDFVQNGKCNKGDKCKYKHEVPEKRGRSHSRGGGRGRSPSSYEL